MLKRDAIAKSPPPNIEQADVSREELTVQQLPEHAVTPQVINHLPGRPRYRILPSRHLLSAYHTLDNLTREQRRSRFLLPLELPSDLGQGASPPLSPGPPRF